MTGKWGKPLVIVDLSQFTNLTRPILQVLTGLDYIQRYIVTKNKQNETTVSRLFRMGSSWSETNDSIAEP